MKESEALSIEQEIIKVLQSHAKCGKEIYCDSKYVRRPKLRFINMEISIKVTKE